MGHCATLHVHGLLIPHDNPRGRYNDYFHFLTRKRRHREVKYCSRSHSQEEAGPECELRSLAFGITHTDARSLGPK